MAGAIDLHRFQCGFALHDIGNGLHQAIFKTAFGCCHSPAANTKGHGRAGGESAESNAKSKSPTPEANTELKTNGLGVFRWRGPTAYAGVGGLRGIVPRTKS